MKPQYFKVVPIDEIDVIVIEEWQSMHLDGWCDPDFDQHYYCDDCPYAYFCPDAGELMHEE